MKGETDKTEGCHARSARFELISSTAARRDTMIDTYRDSMATHVLHGYKSSNRNNLGVMHISRELKRLLSRDLSV